MVTLRVSSRWRPSPGSAGATEFMWGFRCSQVPAGAQEPPEAALLRAAWALCGEPLHVSRDKQPGQDLY